MDVLGINSTELRLAGAEKIGPDGRALSERELEKLKKAAQDFESIFVSQLLKGMRRSIPESGLFGKGLAGDIYSGMFDQEIAKAIAGKGALKLSDMLINSFTNQTESGMTGLSMGDYRLRAVRKAAKTTVSREWDRGLIASAANKYSLDPRLLESVVKVESAYEANAVSEKGAVGLMQLMSETAKSLGVTNRYDPKQNLYGGARYLRDMLNRFDNDLLKALAAYNAGPNAVEKYRGVPPYKETQRYVKKILLNYREM